MERFNSAFLAIKHFTRQPLFIECHRLNHFPNRSLDIGVVMDLMIHDFDYARWIAGEVESVFARGACLVDPAIGNAGDIDTAVISIRFSGGWCRKDISDKALTYG